MCEREREGKGREGESEQRHKRRREIRRERGGEEASECFSSCSPFSEVVAFRR